MAPPDYSSLPPPKRGRFQHAYMIVWMISLIGAGTALVGSIPIWQQVARGGPYGMFALVLYSAPIVTGELFVVLIPSLFYLFKHSENAGPWWLMIISLFSFIVPTSVIVLAVAHAPVPLSR